MVEENFGTRILSPMSDLSSPAEGYGNEVTRTSLKQSCRTKDDHWKKDLTDRDDVNAELVHRTTWTNEKHNMYLNVLEASFVQKLHNSFSFVEKTLDLQHVNQIDSSDQLAVLQKGSWKKINLKKDQPLLCRTVGGSRVSKIESHWLHTHRFPHRCALQRNPDIDENCSERIPSGRKMRGFSHNLASSESQCSFNHSHRKELGIEPEGTDQNFDEEVVEKPIRKKMKRDSMDASTKMTESSTEDPAQP